GLQQYQAAKAEAHQVPFRVGRPALGFVPQRLRAVRDARGQRRLEGAEVVVGWAYPAPAIVNSGEGGLQKVLRREPRVPLHEAAEPRKHAVRVATAGPNSRREDDDLARAVRHVFPIGNGPGRAAVARPPPYSVAPGPRLPPLASGQRPSTRARSQWTMVGIVSGVLPMWPPGNTRHAFGSPCSIRK